MDLFDELTQLGVDVNGGAGRLGGNKTLYKKLLGSFVKSIKEYDIQIDFDENDYDDITKKAHAIKGIAGNLSITPIYDGYSQIVSFLRNAEPGNAKEVLKKILPVQNEITACIERHLN